MTAAEFADALRAGLDGSAAAAAAVLPLDTISSGKVEAPWRRGYAPENLLGYPGYLTRSAAARANPALAFPWAASVLILAIPFAAIPRKPHFIPPPSLPETAGLAADYAARLDYHEFAFAAAADFAAALRDSVGDCRSEVCVDTKPLAERSLAVAAGLVAIGRHRCALLAGIGGRFCLATVLLAAKLPMARAGAPVAECLECGRCAAACPVGAISADGGHFAAAKCLATLTTQRRGKLGMDEAATLGGRVFGCDECVAACPLGASCFNSVGVDLGWVLKASPRQLEDAIAGTPMAAAGATVIKKNAIHALGGRPSAAAAAAAVEFCLENSGSESLRRLARQFGL